MDNVGSFIQKTFSLCMHQKEVVNPYTGDRIMVPCGVCPACRYNKSVISENKVYAQRFVSKYCYFFTASYSNRFIPYYTYETRELPDDADSLFVDCHSVVRPNFFRTYTFGGHKHVLPVKGIARKNESFDFSFACKKEYWSRFVEKADLSCNGKYPNLKGRIPYLCHADLSLFMKRFRKQMSLKNINEKIHSYVVGEYGPATFRPHFHILFFFDSDKLAQNFGRIANSCWRFGRVDWSSSRGKAETYVAAYLNSFASLPLHIQEVRRIRPFSRFSNGFGLAFFQDAYSKAKEGDFDEFINGKVVPKNGINTTIFPWRAVIDTFFFRPASRPGLSVSQLTEVLRYVRNIVMRPAWYRSTNYELPKLMYCHFYEDMPPTEFVRTLDVDEPFRRLCEFLRFDPDPALASTEDFYNSFCSRFYNLFRQSDLFLKGLGIGLRDPSALVDYNRIHSALVLSKKFFDERERESLRNLFKDSEGFDCDWSDIFWNKTETRIREFRESELGKLSENKLRVEVHNRVKHRELNDLNNYFSERDNYQ